jgi:hypothetical protein
LRAAFSSIFPFGAFNPCNEDRRTVSGISAERAHGKGARHRLPGIRDQSSGWHFGAFPFLGHTTPCNGGQGPESGRRAADVRIFDGTSPWTGFAWHLPFRHAGRRLKRRSGIHGPVRAERWVPGRRFGRRPGRRAGESAERAHGAGKPGLGDRVAPEFPDEPTESGETTPCKGNDRLFSMGREACASEAASCDSLETKASHQAPCPHHLA